jgi:hypothetical protein
VIPEATILKETAKIFDLQNPEAKMSKSAADPKGSHQPDGRIFGDFEKNQKRRYRHPKARLGLTAPLKPGVS